LNECCFASDDDAFIDDKYVEAPNGRGELSMVAGNVEWFEFSTLHERGSNVLSVDYKNRKRYDVRCAAPFAVPSVLGRLFLIFLRFFGGGVEHGCVTSTFPQYSCVIPWCLSLVLSLVGQVFLRVNPGYHHYSRGLASAYVGRYIHEHRNYPIIYGYQNSLVLNLCFSSTKHKQLSSIENFN